MNKFLSLLVLLSLLSISLPNIAKAHVLETNGDIGAVLHIDPDDDPYAKIPSQIYFDIKDKSNRFNFSNCECLFTVYSNDKLIHSQKALSENITYTFPQKGVYKISLTGKPLGSEKFSNFTLSYDIRVSREPDQVNNQKKNYLPIVFSTLFLSLFVFLIFKFKNKGLTVLLFLVISLNLFAHVFSHHHNSNIFTKTQDCCLINLAVTEIESPKLSISSKYYEPKTFPYTYNSPNPYLSEKTSRSPPWN